MEEEICKMIYKIEENEKVLKIFGHYFVETNCNKGKIIIKNKKYSMNEFLNVDSNQDIILKIKLVINENIYNKSYMFKNCKSLIGFTICNYYEENIIDNELEEEKVKEEDLFNYDMSIDEDNNSLYNRMYIYNSSVLSEIDEKKIKIT